MISVRVAVVIYIVLDIINHVKPEQFWNINSPMFARNLYSQPITWMKHKFFGKVPEATKIHGKNIQKSCNPDKDDGLLDSFCGCPDD